MRPKIQPTKANISLNETASSCKSFETKPAAEISKASITFNETEATPRGFEIKTEAETSKANISHNETGSTARSHEIKPVANISLNRSDINVQPVQKKEEDEEKGLHQHLQLLLSHRIERVD